MTAGIINGLLCIANYTLLDKTIHPATRCSRASLCPWHTRHLPSSISSRAAFQYLVSTKIDMINDVFRDWRFWVRQRWHSFSFSLKNFFCCSLDCYVSILICFVHFWIAVFTVSHVGFHSCSILSQSSCIALSSNLNVTSSSSIVAHASVTTVFSNFNILLL